MYKDWKGIGNVREYVIPKNPQTEAQQNQRANYQAAALAWQTDGYNALDLAAWNLYAVTLKAKASGWNMFAKLKMLAVIEGKTWEALYNYIPLVIHDDWAYVEIHSKTNQNAKLYLGTSKSNMLTEYSGNYEFTGQYHWNFSPDGLIESTRYYFYIKNTAINEVARSGIYSFKTIAKPAGYFIDEDIPGGEVTNIVPLDRTDGLAVGNTIIIGVGLPTEENQDIKSIQEGISVTIWGSVVFDHYIGEEVELVV